MVNIPNLLSVGRILAVPLFIILLLQQCYGWALVVFIAAAVTDAIDGMLARLLHQRTVLGSYLDPAADKLLSVSSFIILAVLSILPAWLAVVVISRDVIIVLGILIISLTSHPLQVKPSLVSKLATTFQFTLVCLALYFMPESNSWILHFFIWGTGVLSIVSGLQYVWRGVKIFNGEVLSGPEGPKEKS
jgi:cardiolipin synthase